MQATQFKAVEDTASKLVYTPQLDNATPENTEKGRALEAIANLKQFSGQEAVIEEDAISSLAQHYANGHNHHEEKDDLKNSRGKTLEVADSSGTELVEQIFQKRRLGKDFSRELDDLIYAITGRCV